jgi:hypothetical protein
MIKLFRAFNCEIGFNKLRITTEQMAQLPGIWNNRNDWNEFKKCFVLLLDFSNRVCFAAQQRKWNKINNVLFFILAF